jgi:hypothetical protein
MSKRKTEEGLENCPRQNFENEKTQFLWYVQFDKNVLQLNKYTGSHRDT